MSLSTSSFATILAGSIPLWAIEHRKKPTQSIACQPESRQNQLSGKLGAPHTPFIKILDISMATCKVPGQNFLGLKLLKSTFRLHAGALKIRIALPGHRPDNAVQIRILAD